MCSDEFSLKHGLTPREAWKPGWSTAYDTNDFPKPSERFLLPTVSNVTLKFKWASRFIWPGITAKRISATECVFKQTQSQDTSLTRLLFRSKRDFSDQKFLEITHAFRRCLRQEGLVRNRSLTSRPLRLIRKITARFSEAGGDPSPQAVLAYITLTYALTYAKRQTFINEDLKIEMTHRFKLMQLRWWWHQQLATVIDRESSLTLQLRHYAMVPSRSKETSAMVPLRSKGTSAMVPSRSYLPSRLNSKHHPP